MSDATADQLIDAAAVTDPRRQDARDAVALIREVAGVEPVVWSGSMIGFGRQPYTTADGKQHEWFAVGLAPRKAALVLYGLVEDGTDDELLAELGPHTTGKGCLNLTSLDAIDRTVLTEMVQRAWQRNHRPD